VDNAPWRLDGFGHPASSTVCMWYQLVLGLVSILFILGISSLQQMSYFGRSHYNVSNLAFLAARGGTKTPDDVVCYLEIEHSPGLTVDCWSRCSSPSWATKFNKNH
jgi:hypothetical protein